MVFKGKDTILKVLISSTYTLVEGIRSKSITINDEPSDITSDDSLGWREYLDNDGIMRMSISCNGVFQDDAGINFVEDLAYSGDNGTFQITMPNGDTYEGPFQVATLEYGGDHVSSQTFSFTLESADTINDQLTYYETVIADSPIGYWRHGESSGIAAVNEISSIDGTYTGTHALGAVGAISDDSNTAVNFDGIDGHVGSVGSLSDFSFIQNTAIFSVECWAKMDDLSTPNTFIANTPADSLRDKGVYFGHQSPGFITLQGVYQVSMQFVFRIYTASNAITDLDYHHYVGFADGINAYIYIDGVLAASGPVGSLSTGDSSHLMNFARYNYSFGPPSAYLEGDLDEVAIYNYALTPDQILNHYNIGAGL